MHNIPRFCTLDGVSEISDELEGVTLGTLRVCDLIHARTHNSDYEIFLLDPDSGRALVKGGETFAEPVEATVNGSTFGGCMLKMGWLGVGLRMEIFANGQRTVTSPVQKLCVVLKSAELRNIGWDQPAEVSEESCMSRAMP